MIDLFGVNTYGVTGADFGKLTNIEIISVNRFEPILIPKTMTFSFRRTVIETMVNVHTP